jgi:hypothetical protein
MAVSAMCVRALRITVLKSAGNFTRDECHDLSAEKIQRVKCFMFTRCGICCVLAIFERRRGRLGSKISGYGQLAEVPVYFAMSGLTPEAEGSACPLRAYADRTQLQPLARIELAGCSFGSVLWARVECDFRARCCLMDGVDHHLEQGQAFWRNPEEFLGA